MQQRHQYFSTQNATWHREGWTIKKDHGSPNLLQSQHASKGACWDDLKQITSMLKMEAGLHFDFKSVFGVGYAQH